MDQSPQWRPIGTQRGDRVAVVILCVVVAAVACGLTLLGMSAT